MWTRIRLVDPETNIRCVPVCAAGVTPDRSEDVSGSARDQAGLQVPTHQRPAHTAQRPLVS